MSLPNPYKSPKSIACQSIDPSSQIIAEFRPVVVFRIFWSFVGAGFLVAVYPISSMILNATPLNHAGAWLGGTGIGFFMFMGGAMSFVNVLARIRVFENGIELRYGTSVFYPWENIANVSYKNRLLITLNSGKKRAWEIGLCNKTRTELLQHANSFVNRLGCIE